VSTIDHSPWDDERAAYLLDALDPGEQAAFETHLAGCASCRTELRWLAPAIDVLPAAVDQIEPPPELLDRILGAIDGDRPREATAAPVSDVGSIPTVSTGRPSFWSRLAGRPALAGVAAAVALAIGVAGGYALGDDPDNASTVATTVPIEATAPAVQAAGNVVNNDGNWTLDISHLPDLEAGRVYQVWMRKGEQLIPSVLFVTSRDGTAKIVLPGETGTADEMLVTREPSGGSDTPTSEPLISAKL
jgi:anti-sigma-K factor RskA